MQNKRLFRSR